MRRHVEGHGLQPDGAAPQPPQARHRLRPGGARAPGPQLGADRARDRGAPGVPLTATTFQGIGHSAPRPRRARGGPPEHLPPRPAGGRRGALHGARGARGGAHPGHRDVGQSGLVLRARLPAAGEAGVRICLHPDDPRCPPCWRGRRASPAASRTTTASSTSPSGRPTRCSSARAAWPRWGWTSTRDPLRRPAGQDRAGALPGHPGHAGGLRGGLHRRRQNDLLETMRTYKAVGFEGPFMMDHTPAPGPALRGLARARLRQRVHQGPAEHRLPLASLSRMGRDVLLLGAFRGAGPRGRGGAGHASPDPARGWGYRQNTRQQEERDRRWETIWGPGWPRCPRPRRR